MLSLMLLAALTLIRMMPLAIPLEVAGAHGPGIRVELTVWKLQHLNNQLPVPNNRQYSGRSQGNNNEEEHGTGVIDVGFAVILRCALEGWCNHQEFHLSLPDRPQSTKSIALGPRSDNPNEHPFDDPSGM